MMRKFYYLLILGSMLFIGCAQTEAPCLNTAIATIHFVNKDSLNIPYYNRDILKKFNSIHGLGIDQNLLKDTVGSASAYYTIPLNSSSDSSTYVFEGKTRKDTVVIQYKRGTQKCGSSKRPKYEIMLYNLTSKNYTFDSVTVDNAYNEIRIFL